MILILIISPLSLFHPKRSLNGQRVVGTESRTGFTKMAAGLRADLCPVRWRGQRVEGRLLGQCVIRNL